MKRKSSESSGRPVDLPQAESKASTDGAPASAVQDPNPVAEAEMGEATDALQNDIAALNDRLLRLQADFDNFRKRTARERSEIRERSLEDLMRDLLPVLDHFELGLSAAEAQKVEASVREGFQLVFDQLRSVLVRFGLAPMETEGTPFDPHLHEAVTMLPSADRPKDSILEETRRGYMLGGRLLRASQVVVSAGAASDGAEADHA